MITPIAGSLLQVASSEMMCYRVGVLEFQGTFALDVVRRVGTHLDSDINASSDTSTSHNVPDLRIAYCFLRAAFTG